jgi:hypothetical protein
MDRRRDRRGTLSAIHGLPLKVWLDHGKRIQPAATVPPYLPEDFAKLFAVHGSRAGMRESHVDAGAAFHRAC